ncbi:MAG: hybrid sensor histidine kinase/response regulator [Beijerinckiaceae bacterium]|nr:hybrid sensor histidine kinase/response regulator [Beijerinckiaceae bacterium]
MLVVDDDPIYRETSRMFLMMQGRDVTLAENGTAGLRKLGEAHFDILIVDMEMPDMTGLEVIAKVRARPETADLPIIMVTSRDDAMAIDRAYELGASSFVVKPVNWTLLDHYLRFVCRAARNETLARQAQKQAELLGQTKDNLMSVLRHEMKTPLNAIIGFTRLAAEARESGDLVAMREHLEAVQESGKRLLQSFADMSTYSDILSGRVVPAREPIAPGWLFDDMQELHGPALAKAGIRIERREDVGNLRFEGDQTLLASALSRLVQNVLEHAKGATTVTLTAAREGEGLKLIVEDDGEGMQSEDIARCLEPFAQADMSLSRPQQGLGMGLPIANGIMALHGGGLEAENVPDSGLRIALRLPVGR